MAKSKYETNVKPRLDEIREWLEDHTIQQIAEKLGVSARTLQRYAREHEELQKCFAVGKAAKAKRIKAALQKSAEGFYYTEEKETYVKNAHGNIISDIKVEKTTKYCPPNVGAAHLLLKNLDDNWRNDDKATMDLKKEKINIDKQKMEDNW